jgi:hypothetical protein
MSEDSNMNASVPLSLNGSLASARLIVASYVLVSGPCGVMQL